MLIPFPYPVKKIDVTAMDNLFKRTFCVLLVVWCSCSEGSISAQNRTERGWASIENPKLIKLPLGFGGNRIENTPVMYQGRPLLVENSRLTGEINENHVVDMYVVEMTTGKIISRFGENFGFNCAFIEGNTLNVFGTENSEPDGTWTGSIYRFWSQDLKTWYKEKVIDRPSDRHFFNTSVCNTPGGYLMAYESDKPVKWSFSFASSEDLLKWKPIEGISMADVKEGGVLANPTIRYVEPYYYIIVGVHRHKNKAIEAYHFRRSDAPYVSVLMRSKDLKMWDLSPTKYALLEPETEDGINATDADIFEFMDNTYIFYGAGWQDSRGTIRVKMYTGPMKEFFEAHFFNEVPMIRFDATKSYYIYPDY